MKYQQLPFMQQPANIKPGATYYHTQNKTNVTIMRKALYNNQGKTYYLAKASHNKSLLCLRSELTTQEEEGNQ